MLRKFIIATLCLFALQAHSEQNIAQRTQDEIENAERQLKKEIENRYPSYKVEEAASGALSESGEEYIAALLVIEGSMRLAVFKRSEDKQPQLIATSLDWPWGPGDRTMPAVFISKKTITLSVSGSGGCCSGNTTNYIFQMSGKSFPLIGTTGSSWQRQRIGENIADEYIETGTSANYLTREVIHSRRQGKARGDGFFFDGKTAYAEKKLKFKPTATWEISNFNWEEHANFESKTPNLCGWINDKMKFEKCSISKQ